MIYILILVLILLAGQVIKSLLKNKLLGTIKPFINIVLIIIAGSAKTINTSILLALTLAILIAIYFICRVKVKKSQEDEITKMKISGL